MVHETMDHVRSLLSAIAVNSDGKECLHVQGLLWRKCSSRMQGAELKKSAEYVRGEKPEAAGAVGRTGDCMRDLNRTSI